MRSITAYFDGTAVRPLDSDVLFKKNQMMEIKLLDDFMPENDIAKKIADDFGGCLHNYSNPNLIPLEENAWEKSVAEEYFADKK